MMKKICKLDIESRLLVLPFLVTKYRTETKPYQLFKVVHVSYENSFLPLVPLVFFFFKVHVNMSF